MTEFDIWLEIEKALGSEIKLSRNESGIDVYAVRNGERIPARNYAGDLNAMHEAEEYLHGDLWIGYMTKLADIEGSLFGIRSTARQRAEAFLKTIGKWREAK